MRIFKYNLTTFEIEEIDAERQLPSGAWVKGTAVIHKWTKTRLQAEELIRSFLFSEIKKRKDRLKRLEERYEQADKFVKDVESFISDNFKS